MRERRLLSLAVVGIFLLASSAIAVAGDWDWSGPTESGIRSSAPDQGNYESRETVEAGKLPAGEKTMSPGSESGSPEDAPSVEAGGEKFRGGNDTGP